MPKKTTGSNGPGLDPAKSGTNRAHVTHVTKGRSGCNATGAMTKMIAWTRRGHRGPRAAVRAHEHRDALRLRLGASCLAVAIALLWCNCALAAEPRVLLLRGWFGVFSTGMDSLASELKAKGIKAEVAGHVYWSTGSKTS